jgi:hypothetical protein
MQTRFWQVMPPDSQSWQYIARPHAVSDVPSLQLSPTSQHPAQCGHGLPASPAPLLLLLLVLPLLLALLLAPPLLLPVLLAPLPLPLLLLLPPLLLLPLPLAPLPPSARAPLLPLLLLAVWTPPELVDELALPALVPSRAVAASSTSSSSPASPPLAHATRSERATKHGAYRRRHGMGCLQGACTPPSA